MKMAWLTDIHLNFVGRNEVDKLCESIRTSGAEYVLITGDIATAENLCLYLEYLADEVKRPIFFVLGNHDYYHSSLAHVNRDVAKLTDGNLLLHWLSNRGVIPLSPDTCLMGHEGLADGRLGDPEGSTVDLNDYHLIKELRLPKSKRLAMQHKLGDAAAEHLRMCLDDAVQRYSKIIVALHVPPFAEACWHLGENTNTEYLPHFGCKATGDMLKAAMLLHPEIEMDVYCGHTHSGGYAEILPNLRVHSAAAEYHKPWIAEMIEF